MVKLFGKPRRSASRRRIRTQAEWKVEAQTSLPAGPSIFSSLDLSSSAALFVNVMARMRHGGVGSSAAILRACSPPASIISISSSPAASGISSLSPAAP